MSLSIKISKTKIIITVLFLFVSLSLLSQEKFGGLALYTVRDAMSDNPVSTLKAVSEAGYSYFEAASYNDGKFYNMTPNDFKSMINEFGLIPISSHQGGLTLDNADKMIADVKTAGFKYFVIPSPPMNLFMSDSKKRDMHIAGDLERFITLLNTVGEKCKKAGLQLLYHNHDFEFKKGLNGDVIYDYVIEHTNPDLVNFEMDLYWVTKAGADPIAYFEKYPGRFRIWHVKDMDDQERFAPVGKGHIDFVKILSNKELSGMDYYMVEQDNTFGLPPLEAIKISHEGLKTLGFQQ